MTDSTSTITRDGVIGDDSSEAVTIDQATGAELARYPVAGKEEAEAAVAAGRSISGSWWDLGFQGRAQRLRAWQREIAVHGEEAASLIHAENGKPVDDARSEVLATLSHLQFAIDPPSAFWERATSRLPRWHPISIRGSSTTRTAWLVSLVRGTSR